MFKKLITGITIFCLLFTNVGVVLAEDMPVAPTAPTVPEAPIAPDAPVAPTAPPEPTTPPVPTSPVAPVAPLFDPNATPTPLPTFAPRIHRDRTADDTTSNTSPTATPTPAITGTGGANADGQNGGATVNTGDANSAALLGTTVNSNLAGSGGTGAGSATVSNTGNGADSTNNGSATVVDTNTTNQNNSANIGNSLEQSAVSGKNSASANTGGDVNVTTGDANVSGTLITTANTNAAGVTVSEFNIPDSQVGDYVLDFSANCIYNCGTSASSVSNSGNGTDSTNTASSVKVVDANSFQTNDANIDNSLVLNANSGDNRADRNTGGDTNITTGDANVAANSLTMANNNIAGQVIYGVVNIYGDLHGDIIFPEDQLAGCCQGSTAVANTGNGADSTNNASSSSTTNDTTVQTNVASINNDLALNAQTGDNSTSRNTDGSNGITTGDTSITASVLNVANTNVSGDTWLVLVNNAGTWTGQIMGANGANYAGSSDAQFSVDANGQITVTNSGNGAGSDNTASSSTSTNNTTVQTNNVNLNNNLDLSANTGGNSASRNTGGDSTINTGDANIVANLVNFVNNNVTGHGKLIVTVVNVFGSWVGDFIGPGQHKDPVVAQVSSDAIANAPLVLSATPTSTQTTNSVVTPTPTPTPKGTNQLVLGSTGNGTSTGGNIVQVAGYSTTNDLNAALKNVKSGKVVHINLAWLLLLVPAGGIFLLTKKKLLS